MTRDRTEIVRTTHTDFEILEKLRGEVYGAVEFVAKIARGEGFKPVGNKSKETLSAENKEENRRLKACELLCGMYGTVLSKGKAADGPAQLTPEQGLQQARGALVAMPAELAGVVREPAVREAIRKAWDAEESK